MLSICELESILFVSSQPLTIKKLSVSLNKSESEVSEAIENLKLKYNHDDSGVWIFAVDDEIRMGTNPGNAEVISSFVKNEVGGELTKPQLETLTVIAYRGPITRPELEQVRGVNCAIIIRNLIIRGLIEEKDDAEKLMPVYTISLDALSHLGVKTVEELPEYQTLRQHENIVQVVEDFKKERDEEEY